MSWVTVRKVLLAPMWLMILPLKGACTLPDAAMPPDQLAYASTKDVTAWEKQLETALAKRVLLRWIAPDLVDITERMAKTAAIHAARTDKVRLATEMLSRAINPPRDKLPG